MARSQSTTFNETGSRSLDAMRAAHGESQHPARRGGSPLPGSRRPRRFLLVERVAQRPARGRTLSAVERFPAIAGAPSSVVRRRARAEIRSSLVLEDRDVVAKNLRRNDERRARGQEHLETGEFEPDADQPVSVLRTVSLLEPFGEGREAVSDMIFDLALSDHEWFISSEIGSEAKIAITAAMIRAEKDAA